MIEGCLNSRPLCVVTSEGTSLVPLTPGHVLIGSSVLSVPEPYSEQDLEKTYASRWMHVLAMRNNFWSRWRKEVLHQLQQSNKWLYPERNFAVGDIVLIKNELAPPAKWPFAKVIEVYKGSDQLIRVVKLETASKNKFTRSVDRLVLLPVST